MKRKADHQLANAFYLVLGCMNVDGEKSNYSFDSLINFGTICLIFIQSVFNSKVLVNYSNSSRDFSSRFNLIHLKRCSRALFQIILQKSST